MERGIQSPWAASKVVDEVLDLVEVELGGGVGVHHRGVVDVLALGSSAATVSSCTLMLVRMSAVSWGGRSPI